MSLSSSRWLNVTLLAALGATAILSTSGIRAWARQAEPRLYSDGPPPGHTGGFDEPTCTECHSDMPLNEGAVSLRIRGIDSVYAPGRPIRLEVAFEQPELAMAGFQLAARWLDGKDAGSQAGAFRALDDRVDVLTASSGVQYVQHTFAGTSLAQSDLAVWAVEWTAPEVGEGPGGVAIDVAVNAANDDFSEFGDRIFRQRFVLRPDRGVEDAERHENGHGRLRGVSHEN